MSRIKELKENPENNLNLVDLFSMIIPDKKSVYIETLFRIMKKTQGFDKLNEKVIVELKEKFYVSNEDINKTPKFQLFFFYKLLMDTFPDDSIPKFIKFCKFNEKKLIQNNNLAEYTNFEQIEKELATAELKLDLKNLEKQTKVLMDTPEYLVVKPLTHEASIKYGFNTTWCTSMKHEYSHFKKYAGNGILIYFINKITNKKVACYKDLNGYSNEFSFWNQKDVRIDSVQSGLPDSVLKFVLKNMEEEPKTNLSYSSKSELAKEETKYEKELLKSSNPEPVGSASPYIGEEIGINVQQPLRNYEAREEISAHTHI